VEVSTSIGREVDISGAISQLFPRNDTDTVRHLQGTKKLIIRVDQTAYSFSTDKSMFHFRDRTLHHPQGLSQAAFKTLEVVGKSSIVSLSIGACHSDPTTEMWEVFLHGLPQLRRINYQRYGDEGNRGAIDPFVLVFSRPFEGGPVCPKLYLLELPRKVLIQDPSSTVLKRALTERNACDVRLKLIELTGDMRRGDVSVLKTFLDLVDNILTEVSSYASLLTCETINDALYNRIAKSCLSPVLESPTTIR
jgi:hypothetical protein